MATAQPGRLLAIYEVDPSAEQRDALREAYASVLRQGIPPEVLYSFLISGEPDATTWRLVVVWSSREAFESYYQAGVPHPGLAILRSAGCEARLSVFAR
jgi:quinol monooxygenase YgiN